MTTDESKTTTINIAHIRYGKLEDRCAWACVCVCVSTLVLQRPEASDAEHMRGILPPSVAARSLSSSSTEASTSRQSSLSPGTSAPVNGQ